MTDTFSGFTPDGLAFLRGLARHNDRDWFTANRAVFDDQLKPQLASLVRAASTELTSTGSALRGAEKISPFRIHRDTRFSKDKRPYKTHVSATLTRPGPDGSLQRMAPGMAYIHIEPAPDLSDFDPLALPGETHDQPFGHGAFMAVGFYLSERPEIDAVRRAIVADPKGWAAVETALSKANLTLDPGAPAKRLPKGFEDQAGAPLEAAIKRTRWLVSRPLSDADVMSPDLPARIAAFAADARPLLDFGWKALDAAR